MTSTPAAASPQAAAAVLARLERLPMSRVQYGILFAGGLGHLFEALDIVIIGFMLPHLKAEFALTNGEIGLIGGAAPVGMIVGALVAGLLGDRFGRKQVMLYALLLFCAASIALAFADSLAFILVVRMIGGLGAGAEAAIVSPYISEFATGRNRGRFVSGVTLFFSLGNVIAAVLGALVVPLDNGWRIAAVICGLPVLVLLWWRRSLPESPRWLLSQDRTAEAEAVVGRLEERVVRARGGAALPPVPPAAAVAPAAPPVSGSVGEVWRNGLARVTTATWIASFVFLLAFFGFFVWMPSLFLEIGIDPQLAATYSFFLFVAQPVGYLTAILISDRFERRDLSRVLRHRHGGVGRARPRPAGRPRAAADRHGALDLHHLHLGDHLPVLLGGLPDQDPRHGGRTRLHRGQRRGPGGARRHRLRVRHDRFRRGVLRHGRAPRSRGGGDPRPRPAGHRQDAQAGLRRRGRTPTPPLRRWSRRTRSRRARRS